MVTDPEHSTRDVAFICSWVLGVLLAVLSGGLAWLGTQSILTSIIGATAPLVFVLSTVLLNREPPAQ